MTTIEGRGSLMPEKRRITYAPLQGTIVEVPVTQGQMVKAGDLLVRLESKELEKELKERIAERAKALSQEAHLRDQVQVARGKREEQIQVRSQAEEARITAKNAEEQIEIINQQLETLKVVAPQDGLITTWEVKKNLMGRPVEVGQELVTVAATDGDWVLEVEVPDDDMGPVLAAQSRLEKEIKEGKKPVGSRLSAYFVTATDPEHRYQGYVLRISSKAELVETKHVVKVTVGFSKEVQKDFLANKVELRHGAEVRARIDTGEARLAYVMLRDVVHVFYETVLFRWPFLQ